VSGQLLGGSSGVSAGPAVATFGTFNVTAAPQPLITGLPVSRTGTTDDAYGTLAAQQSAATLPSADPTAAPPPADLATADQDKHALGGSSLLKTAIPTGTALDAVFASLTGEDVFSLLSSGIIELGW
jgi:hypothetical protein